MNILSIIFEIGILETLRVISKNPDCVACFSSYIPSVNNEFIEKRICFIVNYIIATKKKILFMMSPETAILEQLAKCDWDGIVIIALSSDLDHESKERIYANVPDGIRTEFISEGTCPETFRPDNGFIICTGIVTRGYRQYIMPSSCRMMSLYKAFQGEKLLFSCFPQGITIPEIGWTFTEPDFFTNIIEEAPYEL